MTTFRTQRLFHELNRQEYRFVIQNHGTIPTLPNFYDATDYRGKFFHRGCHGWIETIEVYIRNAGLAQNVTIGISNFPGATEDSNYTAVAPAGDNWVSFTVRLQWNYDGLFVFVSSHGALTSLAFDDQGLSDSYWDTSAIGDGPWTRDFAAVDPNTPDRRYFIRVNTSQSVGDVPISGFVNIKEVDDYIRVAIANEEGIIVGTGLPLHLTTILTGEAFFNNLADGALATRAYAAGDPFTAGWIAGFGFYPTSVMMKFVLSAVQPRQPFYYENEQIEVSIVTSGGVLVYNETIGRDTNMRWGHFTILGSDFFILEITEEINTKKVLSTEQLIVEIQNTCGFEIAETSLHITGVPVIEP